MLFCGEVVLTHATCGLWILCDPFIITYWYKYLYKSISQNYFMVDVANNGVLEWRGSPHTHTLTIRVQDNSILLYIVCYTHTQLKTESIVICRNIYIASNHYESKFSHICRNVVAILTESFSQVVPVFYIRKKIHNTADII